MFSIEIYIYIFLPCIMYVVLCAVVILCFVKRNGGGAVYYVEWGERNDFFGVCVCVFWPWVLLVFHRHTSSSSSGVFPRQSDQRVFFCLSSLVHTVRACMSSIERMFNYTTRVQTFNRQWFVVLLQYCSIHSLRLFVKFVINTFLTFLIFVFPDKHV